MTSEKTAETSLQIIPEISPHLRKILSATHFFNDFMSMTKRYFTSLFNKRS